MPFLIYGITKNPLHQDIEAKAIVNPDAEIMCVPCEGFIAIVSEVPDEEILPLRRNLLGHSKVLEEIMTHQTVIPMQFGIVLDTENTIHNVIYENKDILQTVFHDIDGKIEVGVKVRWEEKVIFEEIAQEHPSLQKTGASLNSKDQNETYYDRIELGRSVGRIIEQKRNHDLNTLITVLSPYAARLIHLESADEFTVANLALLVDKDREPALFDEVQKIDSEQNGRVHIKYVSPVPPYNFVSGKLILQKTAA